MAPDEKQPQWEVAYTCEHCGREIQGNAYFQHARSCERKPRGATKKLYPVELPAGLYDRFHAWCRDQGLTLAEGVWRLIKERFS
jgi:hypothetical protein